MENIDFFTNLEFAPAGAWIPSVFLIAVQLVFMAIYREGGIRAIDTLWYSNSERRLSALDFLVQFALIAIALFLDFKFSTLWFWCGSLLYAASLTMFIASFVSYAKTPLEVAVTTGVYKLSRNPMYFSYMSATLGIVIATASIWLLIALMFFAVITHRLIVAEESYCEAIYGESYKKYKSKTARYFGIKFISL